MLLFTSTLLSKEYTLKWYNFITILDDIEYKLQQSDLEVLCTGNDHIFIWYTDKGIEKNKIYKVIKENFLITKRVITLKHINDFPKNSAGKILYKNLLLK